MIEFEKKWQLVLFITITICGLIYAVFMSVKDIKWEYRKWWQKLITILTAILLMYVFFLKIAK